MSLFFILITSSSIAKAQFIQAGGDFQSTTTELRTLVLDSEKGIVGVRSVVASGACSGSVTGVGQIKGRFLVFEPYVKLEGAEACRIKIEFDQKWSSARITESEGCSSYHGSACGWEGQTVIKNKSK